MRTGYVIRRSDGQYFIGCGYGGPGHPVPYYMDDLKVAKAYKTAEGAAKAAKSYGGYVGVAELDEDGIAVRWIGFLVWQLGEWRTVSAAPRDFDPNDYEGNNGPLG